MKPRGMWLYALGVLAWWLVNPEIRRVVDFRIGFNSISVISGIPLLLLLPFWYEILANGRWRRLPGSMLFAGWCWTGAFVFALGLAFVAGRVLPGLYVFADFMLPLGFGLWVASRDEVPTEVAFLWIERVVFGGATLLSLYGILQYVAIPPWDAYWMKNAAIGSIGKPLPYQVRVFSALNAPGVFGNFLYIALALVFPKISVKKPWLLMQVALWIAAFALTSDRSAWVGYAVFLAVYIALSPSRFGAIRGVVLTAATAILITAGLSAITGSTAATQNVTNRFTTLGSTTSDESFLDRQRQYAQANADFQMMPFGQGLGLENTANKLAGKSYGNGLDSGVYSRLLEMGFIGGGLFFLGLFIPIVMGLAAWWVANRERDVALATSLAAAIGTLVGALGLELSGDNQRASFGLFTWILGAYLLRYAPSFRTTRAGVASRA